MKSKEKLNNIVILNKLPSNLVKEAIIVLNREYNFENNESDNLKENIIEEAEDVISDFIKQQNKKDGQQEITNIQKRYKRSKYLNMFLILTNIAFILLNFFF